MTRITDVGANAAGAVQPTVILTFPQTRPFHAAGSLIAPAPDSEAEVVETEK